MWPNETVPTTGEDVTIQCDWTVLINVQPAVIGKLIVDGDLVVEDVNDVNITAESVFIRGGSLTVGNSSSPFTHKFTIQVNGDAMSKYEDVDALVSANKFLVVTGSLVMYGVKPTTTSTYLKQSATKGEKVIYPGASSGWKVGDKLSLSPSFANVK